MTTTPLRVLISDDDPMIRAALVDVLAAEADLDVVAVAEDADEAITLTERHRPAIVILDIRMPGGGGRRAAREIRQRAPDTRILAFSAHTDTDVMDELRHLGVTDYLLKGVTNAELITAIRRLGRR